MRRLLVLCSGVSVTSVLAGLYGAAHDQLSFTVSPEYFTRFKYVQFGFDPAWFGGDRPTVALIGFLATWWVGLLIGLFLGGTALLQPDAARMRLAIRRGIGITLATAALCAILGLGYGLYVLDGVPAGWPLPLDVGDTHAFLAVGSMHNSSYGGGVLGLLLALIDMEWRRNKAKAFRT